MHVGHCTAGVPRVLLLPTGLYYSVWSAGRSIPLLTLLGAGDAVAVKNRSRGPRAEASRKAFVALYVTRVPGW